MEDQDILKEISLWTAAEKLEGGLFHPDETVPYTRLLLLAGSSQQENPYFLEVTCLNQILNEGAPAKIFRLSFKIKFPFKIAPASASQTASLIALLNRFLDLPGFEMNEASDELFYRHILHLTEKGMDKDLILGIIGNIMLTVQMHVDPIRSVATGEISYTDLIAKTLKLLQQSPAKKK